MIKRWSEEAWQSIAAIFEAAKQCPFIVELMAGTLARHRFDYFLQQDRCYLQGSVELLHQLSALVSDTTNRALFRYFEEETLASEKELNLFYLGRQELAVEPQKACLDYLAHLQHAIDSGDEAVAMAAHLPCYWVYNELGLYMYQHSCLQNNPYRPWLESYSSAVFSADVRRYVAQCDALALQVDAERRSLMLKAFRESSQLDYRFWCDAYKNG